MTVAGGGIDLRRRRRRARLAIVLAGALAAAVVAAGAAAGKTSRPAPPGWACIVARYVPRPPRLVNLCHWDAKRRAWVRMYHGHLVDAATIPRQTALMCLWFGCPPPTHRRSS